MPRKKRLKIKHNPYAVKGAKVNAFSGGVITRKPLPNGTVLVTTIDEYGRKTETIEQEGHREHSR